MHIISQCGVVAIFKSTKILHFLGNVHVYSNGRMRFAHHQRHERREQQREVRGLSLSIVSCIVFDLCLSQMSLHNKAVIYIVKVISHLSCGIFVEYLSCLSKH